MRPILTSYLVVAGIAAAVTMALVPLVRLLAEKTGLLIEPDSRRLHERPTPYLGGTAMYAGFVVGFGFAWLSGWFDAIFTNSTEPLAVLSGATIACAVGLIDDIKDISAPAKTAGLSLGGCFLAVGGVSIIWFRIPFLDVFVLPYDLALLFSVIWVLGMANAVNFIDGLDGLAAGIIGIGAAAFLLYGVRLGQVELLVAGNVGPLVAALALGICVGFLPWNVHPAQIFMGDSGSLLLGTLMAASTMAVGGRTPDPFSGQTFFFYAPLAIPLLILGVPIFDTAFAIVRRATSGSGLATADKGHLHHRLVRLGHGHRRSVGILWSWTALLSAFVLYPTYNEGQGDAIVPMGVGALALLLFTLFHPEIQAGRTSVAARSAIGDSDTPSVHPEPAVVELDPSTIDLGVEGSLIIDAEAAPTGDGESLPSEEIEVGPTVEIGQRKLGVDVGRPPRRRPLPKVAEDIMAERPIELPGRGRATKADRRKSVTINRDPGLSGGRGDNLDKRWP